MKRFASGASSLAGDGSDEDACAAEKRAPLIVAGQGTRQFKKPRGLSEDSGDDGSQPQKPPRDGGADGIGGTDGIGIDVIDSKENAFHEEVLALSSKWRALTDRLGGPPDGSENAFSEDLLVELLAYVKEQWTRPLQSGESRVAAAAARFGLQEASEAGTLSSKDVDKAYKRELFKWTRLQTAFLSRGMLRAGGSSGGASADRVKLEDLGSGGFASDFRRIADVIARSRDVLRSDLALALELDPSLEAACPTEIDPFSYMPLDFAHLTAYQELLLFVLRTLSLRQLRRYNEACYRQIISPPVDIGDGELRRYPTHAWEHVCDIKDVIMQAASKEDAFSQWKNMVSGFNLEALAKYLTGCDELEFQPLRPDRHWHAFHNGLYCTSTNQFFVWGSAQIPTDVVACNYHDAVFDTSVFSKHFYDVPTPSFHRILESQLGAGEQRSEEGQGAYAARLAESEAVISWVYVFLGRLLFEVGELDSWQIIPFFCGKAGTGKSTILKAAGWFFREEDVETLANNAQKGFGLETFVGKLMWRCMEVKKDFQTDQAQLQSMVSGESVSIMRKHKTALNVTWKVPGILAGNEVPQWQDNGGAVARRVIVIKCDQNIEGRRDPHLEGKIRREMPNLLHKCAQAYVTAAAQFAGKDIWGKVGLAEGEEETPEALAQANLKILPQYFHVTRDNLKSETNKLASFLKKNDDLIIILPPPQPKGSKPVYTVGMPFERFKEIVTAWLLKNGDEKIVWGKEDSYNTVLDDNRLVKVTPQASDLRADPAKYSYRGETLAKGKAWLWNIIERSENVEFDDE